MAKNKSIESCDKLFYVQGLTLDGAQLNFKKVVCGVKALQEKLGIDPCKVERLKPGQLTNINTFGMMYQVELVEDRERFSNPKCYKPEDLITEGADGMDADDADAEENDDSEENEERETAIQMANEIIEDIEALVTKLDDFKRQADGLITGYNFSGNISAYVINYLDSNGRDGILDKMNEYKEQLQNSGDDVEYNGYTIMIDGDSGSDFYYEATPDDSEKPELSDSGFRNRAKALAAAKVEIDANNQE